MPDGIDTVIGEDEPVPITVGEVNEPVELDNCTEYVPEKLPTVVKETPPLPSFRELLMPLQRAA